MKHTKTRLSNNSKAELRTISLEADPAKQRNPTKSKKLAGRSENIETVCA
jgi:hypothetical protein